MADPSVPYPLKITAGSNTDAGATVMVEDMTQVDSTNPNKNRLIDDLDSNGRVDIDLVNISSGYSNGDKLRIKAVGVRVGVAYHTIDMTKGKATITLSETSADYAGASVNL